MNNTTDFELELELEKSRMRTTIELLVGYMKESSRPGYLATAQHMSLPKELSAQLRFDNMTKWLSIAMNDPHSGPVSYEQAKTILEIGCKVDSKIRKTTDRFKEFVRVGMIVFDGEGLPQYTSYFARLYAKEFLTGSNS